MTKEQVRDLRNSLKICTMFCNLSAKLLSRDTITRCRYRWSTSPYNSYATRGYNFRSRQKRLLLLPSFFLLFPSLPRWFRCVSRYARCKTRRARICAPCDNPDVPKRCVFSLRLPWDFLTRRAPPVSRDMNDLTESGVYQVYLFFCIKHGIDGLQIHSCVEFLLIESNPSRYSR